MDTSNNPNRQQPKRIPRWLAYVLFIIVWGVIPWALSLLTPRYGWVAGRPGVWNWLGIIPLGAGITGSLWTLVLHFRGSQEGLEWELTKSYLLTHGPYVFSRNPMYLSELVLMIGWVTFFGSGAVFIAFLVWWALFSFVNVPQEERAMEEHFGEAYRDYKNKVPRWFGKPRN